MWIFTEVADWFDHQRVANNRFLDQTFQGWVNYAVQHEEERGYWPALRNATIYSGTGLLYGLNQLTTSVASGFVDTLRIGDGVREGGWGYGQDALRLLSVIDAAAKPLNGMLKVGRLGLAKLASVDVARGAHICTWVAAARALRMTGVRHFATVKMIEDALGVPGIATVFGVPVFLETLRPALRRLGAVVNLAEPLPGAESIDETLMQTLKANPDAVMPFSVTWTLGANATREFAAVAKGKPVGHTMLAYRNAFTGTFRIMDRDGKSYESISKLAGVYPGIQDAIFYRFDVTAILIQHATITPLLHTGRTLASLIQTGVAPFRAPDGTLWSDPSWIVHGIALEIRSVPFRTEPRPVINVPLRVASAKGSVRTQTFCTPILRSSDAAADAATQDCSVLRTYVVQPGDSLEAIAQTAHGDPKRWRGMAVVNGIKDPAMLTPGTTLVIP